MKILEHYMSFADGRGQILGIIQQGNWQEMNYITTRAGVVRGNHYHEKTVELVFIVEGRIKLSVRDVRKSEPSATFEFMSGDAFIIEPYENHIVETQVDSAWINMLSRAMNEEHGKDIVQP
ncbi:MAG: dTDP-4-dehydrorhamnose 3,5-epimerase family protein [Selenomonadaceae bacterium]|nr:dTDP-4-dehydrorhamnose 3,5-epimerase family protein [Selenomonadaceae bacterium]